MRFSERIGKKELKHLVQIDSMDNDLRVGLWNVVSMFFIEPLLGEYINTVKSSNKYILIHNIWNNFFKEPTDTLASKGSHQIASDIKKRFFEWDYLTVYDFIDFLGQHPFMDVGFIKETNHVLKRELSGYKFIDELLCPISDDIETSAIEDVIAATTGDKLRGVHLHVKEALLKIADRNNPDYRNSIKESISAVEAICQIISNEEKSELGKTLKILKQALPMHGALAEGFTKIYGYTSDSDGIRHAMMEEHTLDQEDALYMLVSCSAFINYLIIKANKAGIKLN
jgi:hypothetical protein